MKSATLTVAEAAELLGVSSDLVYDAVAEGSLPCIRLGRRVLVPRPALDRLLAAAPARKKELAPA
jgi:excisionase family DNA binding protein